MNKTNNLWNRIAPISPISIYQAICSFELFSLLFSFTHRIKCFAYALDALVFFFTLFYWYVRLLWNPASFAAMVQQKQKFRFLCLSITLSCSAIFIKIYVFHENSIFFFILNQTRTIRIALPCNEVCQLWWCASYEGNEYMK